MISIVDTHCHLDLDAFEKDRDDVLNRALAAGVHAMVLIGYNPERWQTTAQMCGDHPFLRRALGIHPNDANRWCDDTSAQLRREVNETRPVAIGEIGLDFYRSADNVQQQERAFVAQLELAIDVGLPVVIHQRNAEEQVIEILERYRPLKGVMHCFTGDRAYAERCLDMGFFLGLGGVLTFPRSDEIREAVKEAPIERLVLETDAPFLAPQSRRGKRNEPSLMRLVNSDLARIKNMGEDEAADYTTRNAVGLFGMAITEALSAGMETG